MTTEDDDNFLSKISMEYKKDDDKVIDSILNKDDDNISRLIDSYPHFVCPLVCPLSSMS